MFTAKLNRKYRDFLYTAPSQQPQPPPLWTFFTRMVHLMKPQWHIIITQTPQFTRGFTFGTVHSAGLTDVAATLVSYRVEYSAFNERFSVISHSYPLSEAPLSPQNTPSGSFLLDLKESIKTIFPNQTNFSSRETLVPVVNIAIYVFNYIFYLASDIISFKRCVVIRIVEIPVPILFYSM